VNNTNGNSNADGSLHNPFSSIENAFNVAGLSSGDAIICTEGHAETVSGAAGIVADVAGVRVIGIGEGAATPTITFSATASTITATAASITFENFIIIPSIDSVVSPFVVSAADVTIGTKERPVQFRDASSTVEMVRGILTTAAADNFNANIIYKGYTGGDAGVNAIRLVGCDNANINVDYYGVVTTGVVEFHTTPCTNVHVTGRFYVHGTTDLSLNVVDTVTGSTWSVDAFDATADVEFSGGDAAAVASDDVATILTEIGGDDATTTDSLNGKIGTDTEMADNSLYDLLGSGSKTLDLSAAIGSSVDGATTDTLHGKVGTDTEMADHSLYDLTTGADGYFVPGLGFKVTKTQDATAATDDLFDVTGKVAITLWIGEVIAAITNDSIDLDLRVKTSNEPLVAQTVIDNDGVGTHYLVDGDVGSTLNAGDAPTTDVAWSATGANSPIIINGTNTIESAITGTPTGSDAILWELWYLPLESGASVAAAA